jgi:branched-chain amino acid transport system ATP-binding protein
MTAPALEAIAINKTYGGSPLLKDISMSLEYGRLALLGGVNGSGKTTLVNCLTGFDSLYSGGVNLDGEPVSDLPPDHRARLGLVRTFQTPHLFASLSVREHLALGGQARSAIVRGCFARWRFDGSDDVIEELDLAPLLERRGDSLSYGEMKVVNLARALSCDARILLLDEPLASLHGGRRELVVSAVRRRVHAGCALLVIEHDAADFHALGCTMYSLANGCIRRETE